MGADNTRSGGNQLCAKLDESNRMILAYWRTASPATKETAFRLFRDAYWEDTRKRGHTIHDSSLDDLDAMQLVIDAFGAAIDELAEESPEADEVRQQLRKIYGVTEASPFDCMITGFCMGLDKGLTMFDAIQKAAAE